MDLNIFKIEDRSGKYSKESFLEKNHIDEYNYIINWSLKHSLYDISFKEKVYLAINNLVYIPSCKNPDCDNKVKYKNYTLGYYEYCSNKCISSDPNIKKIKEDKSILKYGTKAPAQSDIIKDKLIETNRKRYGCNSPLQNKEVKNKANNTLEKNWGVNNPSKNSEIQKKRVNSFKENIDQYKESFKKTSLEKYGVEHHWSNPIIHKKSIDKSRKYKLEYAVKVAYDRIPSNYKLINTEIKLGSRSIYFIECPNCKEIFEISSSLLYERTIRNKTEICTICNVLNTGISGLEVELLNYIKYIYTGEIVRNYRYLGFELDIYLPDEKIAFEFNGLYWHSELYKDKYYHKNKSEKCLESNIELVHIWEDDWLFKNEIIKSIISNKLKLTTNTIYARKCQLIEIYDNKIVKEFLDSNHIQGSTQSSIKIGLYYNNELVSIMVFGKSRISLNLKSEEDTYELIRFVNKVNYNIIGGSSKIFKFFKNKYNPSKVISYSDNSIFKGDLYSKLEFKQESTRDIGYYWVIDKVRKHRYNFRKQNLIKMGFDSKKTEKDIMYEDVKSYRIWDCGNKKWIWNR